MIAQYKFVKPRGPIPYINLERGERDQNMSIWIYTQNNKHEKRDGEIYKENKINIQFKDQF